MRHMNGITIESMPDGVLLKLQQMEDGRNMEARMGKSYSILMGNKTSKQLETFSLRSHWIYTLEFSTWFHSCGAYCTLWKMVMLHQQQSDLLISIFHHKLMWLLHLQGLFLPVLVAIYRRGLIDMNISCSTGLWVWPTLPCCCYYSYYASNRGNNGRMKEKKTSHIKMLIVELEWMNK